MSRIGMQKTFDDVHFGQSTVRSAFSLLTGFLPAEYSSFESCDASIRAPDGANLKFSNVKEFFESPAEGTTLKEFFYSRGPDYALNVSLGSSYSFVSVAAQSRREVDALMAIFSAASEHSKIPKAAPDTSQSERTLRLMTASKTDALSRCCVLSQHILERIDTAILRYASRISYQIDCKDGVQRTFRRLSDLLAFENPPSKDISKLRIVGRSPETSNDLRVWFDRGNIRNVGMDLEGDEQMIRDFVEGLEEQLAAAKPWYSAIAKAEFKLIAPIIFLCFWLVFTFQAFAKVSNKPFPPMEEFAKITMGQWTTLFGLMVAFAFLPNIVGGILNWIRDISFPKTVFAIGQGAKRHADKEIIRTVVIAGFVISLAAGVILLFVPH
jgi:hypothetical protein